MRALLAFMLLLTCCAAANPLLPPSQPRFYIVGFISSEIVPFVNEYLDENPDAEIVLSTPGGERDASEAIADAIIKHGNVRCVVRDQAMSGGFAILQACRLRVMRMSAKLGTHEPRLMIPFGIERSLAGQILESLERSSKAWNSRCGKRLKLTAAEYEAKVRGKDWVLTAREALSVGAVDQLLP